jgi:hypothetical protein
MQQVGTVLDVESERRGVVATSWTGVTMTVTNAADLDREGGLLSVDRLDGATLYQYVAVTDGATDDAPDTVTMATAAPGDWPVDTTDPDTGDIVPAEVRLDVWPELLDVVAVVDLGDGETVPCIVPHSLRPLLVDGVRDPGTGETVQLDRVAGVWTVSDVLSRRPEIQGTAMYWPDKSTLPHVEVTGDTIEVHKADDDGDEIVTTSLGGSSGDFLQLSDDGINPNVSLSSDGSGVVDTLSVNTSLSVAGQDLMDILAGYAKGIVSAYDWVQNSTSVGTSECGLRDIAFDAEVGRTYRIVFDGYVYTSANCRFQLFFRARSSGDGLPAAAPTITQSALWGSGVYNNPISVAGLVRVHLERTITPNLSYTSTSQYRVLLSLATLTSGTSAQVYAAEKSQLYVEDVGKYTGGWADAVPNSGGGTPASGTADPPPATSVKTYTQTWNASSMRSWRGSSQDNSTLAQGYYGGYQRYSLALFPSLASTLSGATLQDVQIYLKNLSWYYNAGGTARIGHYNSSSLPGSPQTSGGGAFSVGSWAPGAAKWIRLPSGWWPDIKAGNITGLTLGEGAGTSATYYGKFSPALSDIKIQIKYTK